MPKAFTPIDQTFSLLETDFVYRERNEDDFQIWEALACDLYKALPPLFFKIAAAQDWIFPDDPNQLWALPLFLKRLVESTQSGLGIPINVPSSQFVKLPGRGRIASLNDLLDQLEEAWDGQIVTIVEQDPVTSGKRQQFTVTFFAAYIPLPTLTHFDPDTRIRH